MKKPPFRISAEDTIKAHLFSGSKLISIVYDSGFTNINQVKQALDRKVSDYDRTSKKLVYRITNEDKQTYWTNK